MILHLKDYQVKHTKDGIDIIFDEFLDLEFDSEKERKNLLLLCQTEDKYCDNCRRRLND